MYLIELFFFGLKSFKCVDIIVSFLGLGSHGSPNDADQADQRYGLRAEG
jgi:hypothetical protein